MGYSQFLCKFDAEADQFCKSRARAALCIACVERPAECAGGSTKAAVLKHGGKCFALFGIQRLGLSKTLATRYLIK